jgi:hypothetical protein
MREAFKHFYEPTDEEIDRLWDEAWFVFDTSALLGLYRESAAIIDELFKSWKQFAIACGFRTT